MSSSSTLLHVVSWFWCNWAKVVFLCLIRFWNWTFWRSLGRTYVTMKMIKRNISKHRQDQPLLKVLFLYSWQKNDSSAAAVGISLWMQCAVWYSKKALIEYDGYPLSSFDWIAVGNYQPMAPCHDLLYSQLWLQQCERIMINHHAPLIFIFHICNYPTPFCMQGVLNNKRPCTHPRCPCPYVLATSTSGERRAVFVHTQVRAKWTVSVCLWW